MRIREYADGTLMAISDDGKHRAPFTVQPDWTEEQKLEAAKYALLLVMPQERG